MLLFYQGEIMDGRGQTAGTRLFALFADEFSGEIRAANPAILWDLREGDTPDSSAADSLGHLEPLESAKRRAFGYLLPELERYHQTLQTERNRQAAIKEKYGISSLNHLILKLDGDLINLYTRRDDGENVDLVIRNKEEQKARYDYALNALRVGLAQERQLTISTPRFLGAVRVIADTSGDLMSGDPNIEQIGMQIAMQYERACGWTPEDVAKQNLGFDVRSTSPHGEKRYIEVKARAESGAVALTQNEWFKAKRFGEAYWLYVVLNAASAPELYRIHNPAAMLKPDEQVEVRYLVSVQEIRKHAATN